MSKIELFFEGLCVVEVVIWIVVLVVVMIFGDFGVDVIKVELLGEGDLYCVLMSGLGFELCDVNYIWIMDVCGKCSISFDLKDECCWEVLLCFVDGCDVFIIN